MRFQDKLTQTPLMSEWSNVPLSCTTSRTCRNEHTMSVESCEREVSFRSCLLQAPGDINDTVLKTQIRVFICTILRRHFSRIRKWQNGDSFYWVCFCVNEISEKVSEFHTKSQKDHNFFIRYYTTRPQVLTYWPQFLRRVQIWNKSQVPGMERQVKGLLLLTTSFICFKYIMAEKPENIDYRKAVSFFDYHIHQRVTHVLSWIWKHWSYWVSQLKCKTDGFLKNECSLLFLGNFDVKMLRKCICISSVHLELLCHVRCLRLLTYKGPKIQIYFGCRSKINAANGPDLRSTDDSYIELERLLLLTFGGVHVFCYNITSNWATYHRKIAASNIVSSQ